MLTKANLARRLALGLIVAAGIPPAARAQTPSTVATRWVAQDIGRSTPATEVRGRGFTIEAGAGTMQGADDQYRFVYQRVSGDVKFTARIDSLTPATLWSHAGLMIRASLEPDAVHAAAVVRGDGGPALQTRSQKAGLTTSQSSALAGGTAQWLGIERTGSRVTAYTSPDGSTWTPIASTSLNLGADVYVGVAVASSGAEAAVAQLSQVSLGGLPAGMQHGQIGGPAAAGTAWHSDGVYTLAVGAAGADSPDQFHFAYRRLQGDLDVVARVASFTAGANAGVMMRESLDAEARHAAVLVSDDKGYVFDRRTEIGAAAERADGGQGTAPGWVKLVRRGAQVEAFRSDDARAWTSIGATKLVADAEVYVGLVVSGNGTGVEASAVLDEVTINSNLELDTPQLGLPNLPPVAVLTSPGNGATFTAPATVTLTALATDPEGRMTQVEFFANGTLVGADSSAPYSFTWSSVPAGSYSLTAVASDADGGRTTSLAVSITVEPGANQAPSVALTSPANGATFPAPATIELTATASDPENRLARVEFYRGGTLLGSDTSAPFSYTWSSVAAGSYTLTARAFDSDGAQTTSSSVSVTVEAANQPPTAALTSPSSGATFTAPATIAMTASASDPENRLARVEFYRDGTLLGSDASSPFSYTWSSVAAGSYTLTARAFDSDGAQTTSSAVTITVNANQAPTVSLTSPANGATFTAPATIAMTASASDPENRLARVEFYRDGTLLGSDASSPFSYTWSSVAAGSYTLTAKAFDSDGAQTTSSAVTITVNANQAPAVSLTSPANGAGVRCAGDDRDDRVGLGSGEPARPRGVLPRRHAPRQRHLVAVFVHLVVGAGGHLHADGAGR